MRLNTPQYIGLIEETVLAAAKRIRELIRSKAPIEVTRKADKSLVLTLDLESQKICLEKLSRYGTVVAEEDQASHARISESGTIFVVDPLDGTSACKRFMETRGGPIGFGPMVGVVEDGILGAAAYYNLPTSQLYVAYTGGGSFVSEIELEGEILLPPLDRRLRLAPALEQELSESALLFYTGELGEARVAEELRRRKLIETAYRFGGFANDCTRLAQGQEQLLVQFAVKAWDFPAVLFAREAGLSVVIEPLGAQAEPGTWKVQQNNPVIIGPKQHLGVLLEIAGRVL